MKTLNSPFFVGFGFSQEKKAEEIKPPVAKKIKKELTIHGDTRIDNYYWLKERDNPEVIDYLKAENEYLKAVMKHTEPLQEKLYDEIIGRIKQTDMSVPYKEQGYYYYTRYEEGKEYPIYCRKKGDMEAEEEILLNVNEMAEGYIFHVAGFTVSSDNNLIAYGVDTVSRRKYKLYFKNLKTGEVLKDQILTTSGLAAWANDNKTVFYTIKDEETLRPYKIMKHVLGTDVSTDKEIFNETDVTFNAFVYKSRSRKFIFIGSFHTLSSEMRFLDADNPDGEFKIIQPREKDHLYQVDHYRDKFYIGTNWEAKNFRLMETCIDKTSKENWKEVIPHRKDVLLEEFEVFKDYLVINERKNGLTNLRIIKWDDKSEHYLDFGEETYVAYIGHNPEFDTELLRFGYMSLTTPNSIFDYNMKTREKKLLKQQEVLGDFDPNNYHAERLYATAKDGIKVPISLVYRKGLEKNGNNPCLLYGYGSYGASMDPYFSSPRLSLLDRGFVFAIAHIRGGQEMGRWWYEDGKLLKKKNTFTDFIACAEHLITEKFTNPEKLFANGASAGGLLMGAVVNLRPDLFKGIIAGVPWVDVITTMLDDSIPLTTAEFDEWGDPKKKEYYDYMLSYSPYDNVEAKNYPAMMVTTGLHDSQVQYFEPAKWAAKLRAMKTDNNLLILDTDMTSGHGGASGRFQRYKRTALMYAFMLDQLGIKE
ncbi:protease 2 [candidate division WOR-1 bacterium DG_54_3]|uniref:Protease 2 n=1 Tax=candidate division WOR-1 bacterium DG_54_3 TaxID=1703775 RepID=A0A0S7XN82_UNCSA|nr:MAG: protease 2 [candidate division WOR-1 bacterium DG_54_3]